MSLPTGSFLTDKISARATLAEKEKKDFQRQREIMDHIDTFYGGYRNTERINKFKINYDLYNGRLDVSLYDDPLCFSVENEQISFDYQNISHTPLIAQIANAIVGEQVGRPFKPMIVDHTPTRMSMLKKKANRSIQNYFMQNVIGPMRDQIMQGILQKSGQNDIFALASTPEQQMALDQEINAQLTNELPKDILEFLNGDIQSPTARQAQKMVDFLVDLYDIRGAQIKGFKNAVITGEEYYYAGERDGRLVFEVTNPMYLDWGGGDKENEWSHLADWVKREKWLSYQQMLSRHARYMDSKDLEIIDLDVEPIGGYDGVPFWDRDKPHTKKLMWEYSTDAGFREMFSDVDINTKSGRQKLFQMYDLAFSRFGDKYGKNYSDYGIREAHIQWRDLRKMYLITRIDEKGRKREFWLPEHYEPTHLDIEVKEAWINQAWEGWKLGTFDCAYVNIRPIPFQYKSIFNPHDVDLSYYGRRYNTHDNATKNMALVDLGKSGQKNFDMVLADIRKDMATNVGSAFTLFMNMRPEGWKWQEWLDLLRNANILMLDPTKNMTGIDPGFLKQINIGRMADIAGKLQLLEFYRAQIGASMYFNAAREGEISQYANAENVQQNTIAVHNKTAYFFEQHRKVVEVALSGFLNRARHYYKENIEEAAIFLDDVSLADLENSPVSWYEWFGIKLSNSEEELQKLQALKSNMLGFIQNGASPESVMQLVFADTTSEVQDVISRETKRLEAQRLQDMQMQQQMQMQQIQANQQEKLAERDFEMAKLTATLRSQEQRTLWDREKFSMQNDIDRNQINDLIQKTLLELQAKMEMHNADIDLEREKLKLKERLESDKLDNEIQAIKSKEKIAKVKEEKPITKPTTKK